MDLKTFLENFDAIAEAPGGIPKLRSLILDLAVRGKLVPQNPEDEPAESVLTKQHELPTSYKRRKKRVKPSDLKLSESLFLEIPASWIYLTIQELYDANILIDFADGNHGELYPRKTDFGDSGITFVTAAQIINGRVVWGKCSKLVKEKADQLNKGWAKAGDVLLTHNATVGRVALVESDVDDFLLGTSVTFYRLNHSLMSHNYLFYVFCSILWQKQLEAVMEQTTRNQVSIQKQAFFKIPLPPLAEQKRIVEKVDELMGLCDRYEAAKQTRDNLRQKLRGSAIASLMNAKTDEELDAAWAFVRDNWQNLSQHPEDVDSLRQAIERLAVQGKLIPQDLDDETAFVLLERIRDKKTFLIQNSQVTKEKLPESFVDESISHDLPKGWAWTKLGYILTWLRNGISKPPNAEEGLKVLRISALRPNSVNLNDFRYLEASSSEYCEYALASGDLLFTRYSGNRHFVGICGVVPKHNETIFYPDKLIRGCLIENCLVPEFISLAINTGLSRCFIEEHLKTTAGQVGIAGRDIKVVPIPIPPLAEQKRIVAKVDELMKLCDQLEASLRQSQQRAESLAASAISHLTI